MSTNILFIFEGPKTEKLITENLRKFFVEDNIVITCAYCTTIYKMYSDIEKDEFLDTFSLVKNIEVNREILKKYKRSDFAEIFMFFDYDGHNSNASDTKLLELLSFFKEETDKGKLYISYPMVEALKHIEDFDRFEDLKVAISDFGNYKKIVSDNCIEDLKHFHLYNIKDWKRLIDIHLRKMNKVVNDRYSFPNSIIDQPTIFSKQLEKYIKIDATVAVLSAFPVFLHDYYGNDAMKKRLE